MWDNSRAHHSQSRDLIFHWFSPELSTRHQGLTVECSRSGLFDLACCYITDLVAHRFVSELPSTVIDRVSLHFAERLVTADSADRMRTEVFIGDPPRPCFAVPTSPSAIRPLYTSRGIGW